MVIWLIGLSGSGKTEIGQRVYKRLKRRFINTVFIDGDTVRKINNYDLGHTISDRKKNSDRVCSLCKMLDSQEIHVVCAILSVFREAQEWNRSHYKQYFEIFLNVPMEILKLRDNKNIYARAERGELSNVVGIDMEFKEPLNSDMVFNNDHDLSEKELNQVAYDIESRIIEKYPEWN